MKIPVQIAGPSYQDRSPQLSSQYTQNVYLGQSREGESVFASYDWPGCKPHYSGSGVDRGMVEYLGSKYKVSGTNLVKIDSSGVLTTIGSIPGAGRCVFGVIWDDSLAGYGLIISADGVRYYYDQSTIAVMSDADLTAGYSVAVMNDIAVFDCTNGDIVHTVYGSPTNVSSFFATTNTSPDGLVRVYAFNPYIYTFGTSSIEQWAYNGASTEFIFSRQEGATIPIGAAARYSIANDENFIFFLGSDRRFYRLKNSFAEPISTPGISNEVESMTTIDDAIGFCVKLSGQSFYVVTFPAENKTLYYSASLNYWGHLSRGTGLPERHIANSYLFHNNRHYVADHRNGNVYEWDFDTYTDNGEARLRTRVMSPLTGAQLRLYGRSITVSSLDIDMEVGVGLASGQGVTPQLMCSVSNDGGRTFGAQTLVNIGALGDYAEKVKYDQFANGRSIVYKIECSDPVYLSIFGGSCEVFDGGY